MNDPETVLLLETAWEVCNQIGGIYTVIRSKAPEVVKRWGDRYGLIGPYLHKKMPAEFEPIQDDHDHPFYKAALALQNMGIDIYYGRWLVSGKPRVILINPNSVYNKLAEIKYFMWQDHQIPCDVPDDLLDQVLAFGYCTRLFFEALAKPEINTQKVIAHFHEWMTGYPILYLGPNHPVVKTMFTTHATLLGRYLAMNKDLFYENLTQFDWRKESDYFRATTQVGLERGSAQKSTWFTTVSKVTAIECEVFLGRKPDSIVPNGLNIQRFTAMHEFQNLHHKYKMQINRFVMAHFFPSFPFDLDKTVYFFTSGRFEFKNKGFDLTIEALARLNQRLIQSGSDMTVVMFFITKQPTLSIHPTVLNSRGVLEEIQQTTRSIEKNIGEKLFEAVASNPDSGFPDINQFVDDYWRLRLKRTVQAWKSDVNPGLVTHLLTNEQGDQIMQALHRAGLDNSPQQRVKVVYHPDFIAPNNPLFGMEYWQFIRGCHLGVFPSYYEPWGYTPLESVASGVPAVTSDLSGFGDYVLDRVPDHERRGIFVIYRRDKSINHAANQFSEIMYRFVRQNRRERIAQRNAVENTSEMFDWKTLIEHYTHAYDQIKSRM